MNNTNSLDTIKNKIRKLLTLSKSDNENEAAIALEKANELISKYELNESDLYFNSVKVKSNKTYIPYKAVISNAVSWLYGCHKYRSVNDGAFVFTGKDIYAFLAGEMFNYLINTIDRCAKKAIRKNAKLKFRRDFKYGMASRLYDRILELGELCSWAPFRETNIDEAEKLVKRSVELIESKANKTIKLNQTAVTRGAFYGNNVSLSRQAGYTPVKQIPKNNKVAVQGELF